MMRLGIAVAMVISAIVLPAVSDETRQTGATAGTELTGGKGYAGATAGKDIRIGIEAGGAIAAASSNG